MEISSSIEDQIFGILEKKDGEIRATSSANRSVRVVVVTDGFKYIENIKDQSLINAQLSFPDLFPDEVFTVMAEEKDGVTNAAIISLDGFLCTGAILHRMPNWSEWVIVFRNFFGAIVERPQTFLQWRQECRDEQ